MSTNPLSVQVAEALGWEDLKIEGLDARWYGIDPFGGLRMQVPPYAHSWCSAGALVNRYKIGVTWDHGQWIAEHRDSEGYDSYAGGDTPTEAVARMVLLLSKKGKLVE